MNLCVSYIQRTIHLNLGGPKKSANGVLNCDFFGQVGRLSMSKIFDSSTSEDLEQGVGAVGPSVRGST